MPDCVICLQADKGSMGVLLYALLCDMFAG